MKKKKKAIDGLSQPLQPYDKTFGMGKYNLPSLNIPYAPGQTPPPSVPRISQFLPPFQNDGVHPPLGTLFSSPKPTSPNNLGASILQNRQQQPLPQQKQGTDYASLATFGLGAIDALIPSDRPRRNYQRPQESYVQNKYGTGSQALAKRGASLPMYDDGGPITKTNPQQRAMWNDFLSFVDKKGLRGSKELDKRDKSLGLSLLKEYNSANPSKAISEDMISIVQKENQMMKKGIFPGMNEIQSKELLKKAPYIKGFQEREVSPEDNWFGSITSTLHYPNVKKMNSNKEEYNYGTNLEDFLQHDNPDVAIKYKKSTAKLKMGGKVDIQKGGDLKVYDGSVEALSTNPLDASQIVQFNGPSHEDGGIPISYGQNQVEVEGGETAYQTSEGDLQILGNMKVPGTTIKFKKMGKQIAKEEKKLSSKMDKGLTLINDSNTSDPFERLSFNTGRAILEGTQAKLANVSAKKEQLAYLQEAMLSTLPTKARKGARLPVSPPDPTISQYLPVPEDDGVLPPYEGDPTYKNVSKKEYDRYNKSNEFITDRIPRSDASVTSGQRGRFQMGETVSTRNMQPLREIPMGNPLNPVNRYASPLTTSAQNNQGGGKTDDKGNKLQTDGQNMDLLNILPEAYAFATDRYEPVQMQKYTPDLLSPYSVSFQDQMNENEASFNSLSKRAGYNPEALSTLAGQKYAANSGVLANEFRTNQGIANQVANQNVNTLNDAELKNLAIGDTQYTRMEQAKSNTKQLRQNIISSISNKFLQNKKDNNRLATLENLYEYRFDPNFKAMWEGANTAFINKRSQAPKGKWGGSISKMYKQYK